MSLKYSENHHLSSDEGGANVHVALHLQGATLQRAMEFVDVVLAAARGHVLEAENPIPLSDLTPYRGATVLRPRTSGPCVHLDKIDDDDPEEVKALGLACRHPGRMPLREDEQTQEWECPHLDAPDIICPVRDACYAMHEVLRMRDASEQERGIPAINEQTGEVVPLSDYVLAPPEAPEEEPVQVPRSPRKDTWTAEEDAPIRAAEHAAAAVEAYRAAFPGSSRTEKAIRKRYKNVYVRAVAPSPGQAPPHVREWTGPEQVAVAFATSPTDAVRRYRAAFPDSERTDGAIRARYHAKAKADREAASTPDFAGDTVPVTQCEELDPGKGDPDQVVSHEAPSQGACDRPLSEAPFAVGDKVVHQNGPPGVGEVLFVGKSGRNVSVQFPGSEVSHVYEVAELQRVEE